MLRDADRSLANWLGQALPPGVGLRFEPPAPHWVAKPPEPLFVDAFLHSVKQDSRGGQSGWSELRDSDGRLVGRQPTTRYFRLTYLITAWATGQGDGAGSQRADYERVLAEHEVLGFVLDACVRHGSLPSDCLEGTLAESGTQTLLECAPADSPTSASALWAGLSLAPRAHIELVLVTPTRPPVLTDLAPPAREIVLNAGQEPGVSPARASTAFTQQPAQGPFGTLRRWEKHTVNEPAGQERGEGDAIR
ncbi:MAG TPA: Pvc16 family protein [Streptosporangiaceae bacterium]|nr:Pvc16 family protein [Streptosporangiaceae bacterium]